VKGDAVENDHDFSGYATVANRKCSDGLTIMPQAFAHMDKRKVPLVFQHIHTDQKQVVGHAILQHDEKGVYAYGFLNETSAGKNMKLLIQHKDLDSLSIYANNVVVKEKNKVVHGNIREVSVVLSGANEEAKIDFVRVMHSDAPGDYTELDDEALMYFGEKIEVRHSDEDIDTIEHKTVQDVYDTLDEEQKQVVHFMIGEALKQGADVEHSEKDDTDADDASDKTDQDPSESGDKDLAHKEGHMTRSNVFEKNGEEIQHGAGGYNNSGLTKDQIATIIADAKEMGLQKSIIAHAEDYGITNIEVLFPDAKMIDARPEWITRRLEWVEGVLNSTQKLPFSRIKSRSADLTFDTARAKGYIKGTMKKDQFFTISQRETTPKTIYKRQKLDRDDIIDITDFDIVAWLWVEMRFMLREEVARAILVGDGREVDDPDKINENNIRPIAFDDTFYTDVRTVGAGATALDLVDAVLLNRQYYLGSSPTAYMTTQTMVEMLLTRDELNRRLYRTKAELAAELMVRDIVEVPVMEGATRDGLAIVMILVNLSDYAVGSTKGGEITTFEDFDIDWNQYKYLIETRLSGALVRHKTAQVILKGAASTLATLTEPTFVKATGVLTVPTVTGVTYYNVTNPSAPVAYSSGAQPAIASGATIEVEARPNTGYHFAHGADNDWFYTRD
jgi:HK97 family phage prohead protease